GWLEDFANQWADFLMTGKFDFESFADSIIRDIIRIKTEATLAKLLGDDSGSGVLGGLEKVLTAVGNDIFGGGSDGVTTDGPKGQEVVVKAHTGGIVGSDRLMTKSVSPSVFYGAPRYHTGGIISQIGAIAGLAPNEVPVVAKE